MKDIFITFETAKLAKQKGFDEFCDYHLNKEGMRFQTMTGSTKNSQWDNCTTQPTQSLLQRWLREVHQIDIIVLPKLKDLGKFYGGYIDNDIQMIHKSYGSNFKTYEDALEYALQTALNQIKN